MADTGRFLLYAGLLTLALLIDDAFLVHEVIAPEYLGLPARFLFAAYALAAAGILWRYRLAIARSDYLLLVLALALLAVAAVADELSDRELWGGLGIHWVGLHYLLEDGCKLLGIAGWLGYFTATGYRALALEPEKRGVTRGA